MRKTATAIDESRPDRDRLGRRRWVRRAGGLLLGLVVLMLLAHRPVLRWTLDWAAHHFAKKAGLSLDWQVAGSVWSDLDLQSITLTGPSDGVLQSLNIRRVAARYDVLTLLREGAGHFMNRLEISDAVVHLDLRQPPPSGGESAKNNGKGKPGRLPGIKLGEVRIENVTVRAMTLEGELLLKGLTLVLSHEADGRLEVQELVLPKPRLQLTGVQGTTRLSDGWVHFHDLAVMPDVILRTLSVDVARLSQGALPVRLRASSGESSVEGRGEINGLGGAAVGLDLQLEVVALGDEEIRRWVGLPEGLRGEVRALSGRVSGIPAQPRSLKMSLEAQMRSLALGTEGPRFDALEAQVSLEGGHLEVQHGRVVSGSNLLLWEAEGELGPTWAEVMKSPVRAKFVLSAPALGELMPAWRGRLEGRGEVAFANQRLSKASIEVGGNELFLGRVTIKELSGKVVSDHERVVIEGVSVSLDEVNRATLSGEASLAGRQRANLNLAIQGNDLSLLYDLKTWADLNPPTAGALQGTVKLRCDLADLREKGWDRVEGAVDLALTGLQWNQGMLEAARLKGGVKESKVTLDALELVFDMENAINFSGELDLRRPKTAMCRWHAELDQIAALVGWVPPSVFQSYPAPHAGRLKSEGQVQGNLAGLTAGAWHGVTGRVKLELAEVQWLNATLAQAVAEAQVDEGRVTLSNLDVQIDEANRITAGGSVVLGRRRAFQGRVQMALPRLDGLAGWSELVRGPEIKGGALHFQWSGSGDGERWKAEGRAGLKVANLSLAGWDSRCDLEVEAEVRKRTLRLDRLWARSGTLQLELKGAVSEDVVHLERLALQDGQTLLAAGRAEIPLAMNTRRGPGWPLDGNRPLNVDLTTTDLKWDDLGRAVGWSKLPVSAEISGMVRLAGRMPELSGRVDVQVTSLMARGWQTRLAPASFELKSQLEKGLVEVQAALTQRPLQTVTFKGSMPLDLAAVLANPAGVLDSEVTARLTLPESDLAFVPRFVPSLTRVKGRVGVDVSLSGPVRRPAWRGSLQLLVPEAEMTGGKMSIKELKARINFREKQMLVEEASALLSGGLVQVSGSVDLRETVKPDFRLEVKARDALVLRDDTMSLRADGRLTVQGPLDGAAVAGRVELVRGRVFKEIEFLPLSLPNQLPPPPPRVRRSGATPAAPAPFDKWKLDVKVVTRDPIRLLGNVLNGGVVVDLHAGGTGAQPEVTGQATFDHARVQLPFSRLHITRGNILFLKERPLDPVMDLQGDSIVGNYVVTLFATGPALAPRLRFTSNPPLSEGEIATLLATGSSAGDLTSSEGVAANRAAFLLLSQTYRKLFRKAAPRRLNEEPPRLSFSFAPLNTGNTQRAVTATYEISPRLQVVGEVSERGTFRGLLHYLIRFH